MEIREASERELFGLLKLYSQLHNNPLPEAGDKLSALWNDILQDKNHHIIVAVDNDTIISSCVLIVVPNLTHGQHPYALIENVITDTLYRGRGLASACLAFARQIAQKQNCYKIMLMTGSKEDSTLNFYRRANYNSEDKTAFVQWL